MASNESKCRDCGEILVWDDKNITQNGKKFPVEKNGNRHNCPLSKYNREKDKGLGDMTPMEALSSLMKWKKDIEKRLSSVEIEVKWGSAKTLNNNPKSVEEPVNDSDIDWGKFKATSQPEEKSDDPWEKYKK